MDTGLRAIGATSRLSKHRQRKEFPRDPVRCRGVRASLVGGNFACQVAE